MPLQVGRRLEKGSDNQRVVGLGKALERGEGLQWVPGLGRV